MSRSSPPPSAAEWKVLKIVADLGPCAAREVVEACEPLDWSQSTVKTLLRRLVEKGHLKTKRVGNSFLYRPSRSLLASLRKAADALLQSTAEENRAPLLAYMVRQSQLSSDELSRLRQLIDETETTR